jgi:phosphinothricin acetyltransferase
VARHNDTIVGWAALSPVSKRHVYRGVVEESIYIAPDQRGNGIGKLLLSAVIEQSEAADIWTIQTSIFPENKPSLALHERCGFRVIGQREKIGQLDGVWRDVFFLERRSTVAGI